MIAHEILAQYLIPTGFMVSFLRKPEAETREVIEHNLVSGWFHRRNKQSPWRRETRKCLPIRSVPGLSANKK